MNNNIKLVLLDGVSGAGKTYFLLEVLNKSEDNKISIYETGNEYVFLNDIPNLIEVHNYPDHPRSTKILADIKKKITSDLLNDKIIIIEGFDNLLPIATTATDVFNVTSNSTIIIPLQWGADDFFNNYPSLEKLFHKVIHIQYKMANPLHYLFK